MGAVIPNKEAARKAALASIAKMEQRAVTNVSRLIHDIDGFIKARTPVNTGSAVRNYIWTTDTPFSGYHDPIDNGDPGPTNSMTLGTEPRRAVNEAAAAESLGNLDMSNPFQHFILTNNDPDIEGLEMGLLPGPPLASRSPNGMFGVAQAYFTAKLNAKGILS